MKGKEMGARYAGTQDLVRVFNRALELLNSTTPESDQELLELVRKSKREVEKEPSVPPAAKKTRTITFHSLSSSFCTFASLYSSLSHGPRCSAFAL